MSRRSSYRSEVSGTAVQLFWTAVLLALVAILWATGWGTAILGWAGDLMLERVKQISET